MSIIKKAKKSLVAKYLDILIAITEENGNYIYRGLENASWESQSGAQRRLNNHQNKDENHKKYGHQEFILYHKHLIENAKDLGYDKNGLKTSELSELEILAEIQHHGGATCLTDFTTDFLVALWFASKKTNEKEIKEVKNKDGEVVKDENMDIITNKHGKIFAVNLLDDDNFEKIYPIREIRKDNSISGLLEKKIQYNDAKKAIEPRFWLWKPTRLNNRIVQQDSIFLFGLPNFESIKYEPIYIPEEEKDAIQHELEIYFALSSESVFDDLTGFSFEANNADKPIGTTIFEKRQCFDRAKSSFKRGEFESAIKYYNRNLQCLNETANCDRNCKNHSVIELLFERGRCFFEQDKSEKSLKALSDFEKVINLKDDEQKNKITVLGASLLKLQVLYKLENFTDAFNFCLDVINSNYYVVDEIKEFFFSALELSVIMEDGEKFKNMIDLFNKNTILCQANGELLYLYFKALYLKQPYIDFSNVLDDNPNKKEKFDVDIFWSFDDIEKWIIKKNNSNQLLLTQKIMEIQDDMLNREVEKICKSV